jgi:hypothetical protein
MLLVKVQIFLPLDTNHKAYFAIHTVLGDYALWLRIGAEIFSTSQSDS